MNREEGKKRVLIVEDELDNRELVIDLLEDDFTLLVATNGDHAVELTKKEQPQVVLMDLKLDLFEPPTTGFDLTERLRKLPEMQNIPIIAASARSLDHERKRAIDAGCNDLITKPFQIDDLISLLEKA